MSIWFSDISKTLITSSEKQDASEKKKEKAPRFHFLDFFITY